MSVTVSGFLEVLNGERMIVNLQNIPKPVNISTNYRIGFEKVVLKKFYSPGVQGFRVFTRPDLSLCLFERWGSVLNNERELWIDLGELKTESTWSRLAFFAH